jgi:FkbM family methyltransferase
MTPLRARVAEALIRKAGWPPAARAIEGVRNLATYAIGAGTASLHVEQSGEGALLRDLAERWSGREVTLVDVGAHTGEYAVCARAAFGPALTLHCFEPRPDTFALLERRVGAEPRTSCHRLALGDEAGTASLFSKGASSVFTSLYPEAFGAPGHEVSRVDEVELRTLDDVADDLGLERIGLLKVDVEGHELAVLKGARRLLDADAIEAVQFEFGERSLYSRAFLRDFFELLGPDFDFFRITPFGLRRLAYSPAAEVFVQEANYLAARASAGLASAAPRAHDTHPDRARALRRIAGRLVAPGQPQ